MMSRSAGGSTARRPKRAMACSWLPHTCMIVTGRPMASTLRRSASASARARTGSRNFSSLAESAAAIALVLGLPGRDLAAHVRGHEVVGTGRAAQHLVEQGQRLLRLLG